MRLPSAPTQREQDRAYLVRYKRSRLNKLVNMEQTVTVGASVIQPAAAVRDLGVLLDQELNKTQHIANVSTPSDTSSCRTGTRSAGVFVLSRLDYGNAVLTGLPKSAIMPLRRVQHAAARLLLDLRMNEHVTPALRQIHWLPVDRPIDFKLCTMMHSIPLIYIF